MNSPLKKFATALFDEKLRPTALKVSVVVGSILFTINHGSALVQGKMTSQRWISGLISYLVPYSVNIHGQYTMRSRSRDEQQQTLQQKKDNGE
ncbi:MAG: hypothetical protein F6J86_35455 [Symploca sp. SIO1B1]|nr:hypothetical protein [Symploca sp. SIO2D2]NER25366.1 hypothetical protein [Symploca sp. SIO1C2]NER99063.1 hypothetical protein [Symploca sp. SIO1B1]